jgi:hypothetical protein
MAKMNYETVLASAGFAGESFDISAGYGSSSIYVAEIGTGDIEFFASTNTITTLDEFPVALTRVGKEFVVSGSANNNGTYFVVSSPDNQTLIVNGPLVDEAAITDVTFNGTIDTAIIDVLLSAGDGILTTDAPLVLTSTGLLGAARTLSIADLEEESALQGGEALRGRFFYLTITNTDITTTNTLTVTSSGTINEETSFVITSPGDYMFFHISNGAWRCSVMPRPEESIASLIRVPFTAAGWSAGDKNSITIPQSGTADPAAGEFGPHTIAPFDSYMVQVINTDLTPNEIVDVEVQFALNGNVTLVKAQKARPFNGIALICGTLD